MGYNKTMNFLIFNCNPNGLIMGELSNWNGRVYKMSRNALNDFKERSDSQHTGVYFLFGRDQDMNDTIYVGEAEQMYKRLKQHINDQEEWNDCVAVISKDDHLNKAHAKHLEHDFYQLAIQAHRYAVINSTVPVCSSVSEYDQAMISEFIDHTKLLVNTLGYKAFEGITALSLTPPSVTPPNITEYIIISVHNADARGISVADGFTVLNGSRIASEITPSCPTSYIKLRSHLIETGVIDSSFRFTRDYLFSSPSTAASVVRGASINGRIQWKTSDGKTLADVERSYIPE